MPPAPLLLLTLLAAAPAAPPGTEERLREHCRTWAADPSNPWALAHGMTLEGRDYKAKDGRPAAEVIVSSSLRRSGEGAQADLRFDSYSPDGTPVEPHTALQVKTLVLAGLPRTHSFRAAFGPVTLGALVEDLQRDFRPALASSADGAWALDALSHTLAPGASFRNGAGEVLKVDALMEQALAALERDNAELEAGMRAGRSEVPKRKQGIYAHPCGGMHFFQAVATWARHPKVRKAWGKRLDTQVEVLLYRLDSETRQYRAVVQQAPQYKLLVLVQQLKFYGHLLESLGRYREEVKWKPTAGQQRALERARALLDDTVRQLEAEGAFRNMQSLRSSQRQVYLDLIGDSCHAANGLRYWRR